MALNIFVWVLFVWIPILSPLAVRSAVNDTDIKIVVEDDYFTTDYELQSLMNAKNIRFALSSLSVFLSYS